MPDLLLAAESSAPTLIERAAAAAERARLEAEGEARRRADSDRLSAISTLSFQIEKHLGVAVNDGDIHYDPDAPRPKATVEIDGLTFAMFSYSHRHFDPSLCVARPCERGCGEPVWVQIGDYQLAGLHRALTEPQEHQYDCLVLYVDGEPITDRFGKPLPPPEPSTPTPSAYERAKAATDAIETAAAAEADAIRAERAAVVARDEYLTAFVQPLIGTPNPLANKPHSQASAAAVAESDPRYKELCAARIEAEGTRLKATAASEAARLRARLALEVFTSEERNR